MKVAPLVAIAAASAFVVVALALALDGDGRLPGDGAALRLADSLRTPLTADLGRAVTALGHGPVAFSMVLVSALVLVVRRHAVEAAVLVTGIVLTLVALDAVKEAEGRARPLNALVPTDSFAYPSGHAAYGVAYVAMAIALSRAIPSPAGRFALVTVAVVVAVTVGLSRVYLRAHFLSDVVGGWALAAAIFALCAIGGLVVAHLRHNGPS